MSAQLFQHTHPPPKVKFPVGQRSQGGRSTVAQVLCQLSQQRLQPSPGHVLQHSHPRPSRPHPWRRNAVFLRGSLCRVLIYPLVCIEVPLSSAVKNGQKPRRDEMETGMTPNTVINGNEEKQQHTQCVCASGLQQGDTNPHSPGFRYFSQRPGSSRLLICLCFLSLVLSISVVAMEVCPVYLVDFTLSSGSQKFALKHCCESFNLKAYDCFALKRLSRKKDDCSVQSCSSTKHIAQRTE